jgi:class 3 adenylate cyclase/tetratricopeptide (TPR) repeat protein
VPSLETVTILITDLVGSTGMASRLGPAAAEDVRQEHFAVLRSALEEGGGREVKNTGDGLMLAFGSASGAVECAISMQQLLERRNADAEEQLSVRIGIGAGEASQEDGDYFGMPPTEAARLCNAAAGGQILTNELVRMMAGRHADAFRDVGELELKGLPTPYRAYEVEWEPATPDTLPLPQALRGVPPIGYVGRDGERERLEELWSQARQGERRVALISGEPGIGKTRLATHTALQCHAEGAAVLFGRCAEDLGAPYGPWIEALSTYVENAPTEVLEPHVERHGGELTRLVPALARRLPDTPDPRGSDPETERYLLFGAVLGLLEEAAGMAPVVLVLDDLHWADVQSLALLRHVVTKTSGSRLAVLGTFRDSELDRQHPLTDVLAALRREEGVERVSLTGLGSDDVVAIMEAAAGHGMDDTGVALAQEIASETDGNPFFVAELLRHLSESGVLAQRADGRWELKGELAELGMPQSVREVIGRRVERLGEKTRGVLTVAAVIGREFDVDLLERVAREDEDELLDLLERAVESSLLVESAAQPGRFAFAHALINHTLYEEHGATRRARLHLRIAEALEELCGADPGPRLAELAHHWSAATASIDPSKAVDYSRRAAERALGELAPDEAVKWFSHALELEQQRPDGAEGERCDLLIGLGEAQRQTGEPEFRGTLLEAGRLAERLGDGERMAAAALANTRGYTSEIGLVDVDREAMLRRAMGALPEEDPRQGRLQSLLSMELHYGGTLEERRRLADRAVELARSANDPSLLAHVQIERFFAIWCPHTVAERRELVDELETLSQALGDPFVRYWTGGLSFHVGLEAGDAARVDRNHAAMKEVAQSLGEPFTHWFVTWLGAARDLWAGRLEAAESVIEESVAFALEHGQGDAMIIYVGQLTPLRREQGRMAEVEDVLRQSLEDNPGVPGFGAALALAYTETGRDEEAAAMLEAAAADGFESFGMDVVWLSAMTMYADVAAHLRATEAAATLESLLEPFAGLMAWNGAGVWGSVSSALGRLSAVLGRHEQADSRFAAGAEALERLGAPLFLGRTRLWWAESLLERNETARARELLEQAASAGRDFGSPPLERRAEELLADAQVSS